MLNAIENIHYSVFMNRLPLIDRARILQMLIEGNSLRTTTGMANVSINTVRKLLVDVAEVAHAYHDLAVRGIRCRQVHCDEIWCFMVAQVKNAIPEEQAERWDEVWTWIAIDADTKLCISYLIGGRDEWWAKKFIRDVSGRIRGDVELTTDRREAYLDAVGHRFGTKVDFAHLKHISGASNEAEMLYSPPKFIGCNMKTVSGCPCPPNVSTSFMERQSLTTRISMPRSTRFTKASSKKVEIYAAAVALHFIHYNFARLHETLCVTPAMAAGISDHVWSYGELAALAT
jgi:hypothetical protein